MKKPPVITKEEFEAIKNAVESTLGLWRYDFIEGSNESGAATSMSKETFFDALKREFIITN